MKKISTLTILSIVFVLTVLFVVIPDRDISDMENRTLAKMPSLTFKSYFDGTFKTQFEKYVADQFPFRDELLKAYKKITVKIWLDYEILKNEIFLTLLLFCADVFSIIIQYLIWV